MKRIFIEPGQMAWGAREEMTLETFLGSCVGVTLFDKKAEAGGMVHILLPDGPEDKMKKSPGTYAESAIPLLIESLEKNGASPKRLEAHMAGGAHIVTSSSLSHLNIGQRNIIRTKEVLDSVGIPIIAQSLGGSVGRGMKMILPKGKVETRLSRTVPANAAKLNQEEDNAKIIRDEGFLKEAASNLRPDSKVAIRALQLIGGDLRTLRELEELVMKDQILAGRILGMVNSARFALPKKVTKLSHAISLLGTREFKKLVMQACLQDLYSRPFKGFGIEEDSFSHHAVACANLAQFISERTEKTDPEEAYLAGLMHDIGKILIERHFTNLFFRIKARVAFQKEPFIEAEKNILNTDHAELGAFIAQAWELPSPLCEAIGHHHRPRQAENNPDLVAVIHLSNYLCNMMGVGLGADTMANVLDPTALRRLCLNEATVTELIHYVPDMVCRYAT